MNTREAPDITLNYPSKGKRVGPAWADAWRALQDCTEPLDGTILAAEVADRHSLSPLTVLNLLSRAADAGLLVRTVKPVAVNVARAGSGFRSSRTRAHYEIRR